jgi:MFS family permease
MKTVDVGAALDEGQWGGYQKLLVFATALTIILDGLDNQLLPPAIPVLMKEWGQPRAAFGYVLTSGMVGMMLGGFIGGAVGDRMGRRVALLGSVVFFGLLTILVSFSTGVTMMIVLRFLSGLGLGGAMPNAAALSSEYVPRRQRPFAVTLTIVCIPLGGSLAGIVGGLILPTFGWRALFLVGGIVPLLLAGVLLKVLPESPRYLTRMKERWPELRALMGRLGHAVPGDAVFIDGREKAVAQASVGQLFVPEFRRDTLALCGSFFFCLLSVYMGTNWVPQMLTRTGFDVGTASWGLTAFNFGGVAGAIIGAGHHAPGSRSRCSRCCRRHRRIGRAVDHGDRTAGQCIGLRHAGVDGRSHQRRPDHDVRARRPRLSHIDSRHRRWHGSGLRPDRRRHQSDARGLGPRHGRAGEVFRHHRGDDDDGVRRARGSAASRARHVNAPGCAPGRRGAGSALAVGSVKDEA